jgi:hypothetical protein
VTDNIIVQVEGVMDGVRLLRIEGVRVDAATPVGGVRGR